ncbi:MAG: hypothetical protein AAB536_00490 [Patescibacteria group bacterium]
MSKNKLYAVFFIMVATGTAAVYFVSSGYYPIAVVNGKFISERAFADDYAVASLYYRNFLKTYQSSSSTPETLTPEQIQKSVLTGLIENILIDSGARKETGGDIDGLVKEKIDRAASGPDMEQAVKALYGLNIEDFKEEILAPQAKRDILTGSLFLKGEKIDDWLAAAKKSSRVLIFSGKFYWDGESVASH